MRQDLVEQAVQAALAEDLGLAGDLTTNAIVAEDAIATARIVLREDAVIAGIVLAIAAFRILDPGMTVDVKIPDGRSGASGAEIMTLHGKTRAILSGERVALNYLQRLCGIATTTRAYVKEIEGTSASIVCTRKTTPGLRVFEKYAVRAGGGQNHRFGLFDAVLIKDNHIAAAGSVSAAIEKARMGVGHLVKIEVEVDTLDQLDEALGHTLDAVLLDNMTVSQLRTAVERVRKVKPSLICEASGGIRLETVRAIAETGVDLVSVGALTHSARSCDIGLDV